MKKKQWTRGRFLPFTFHLSPLGGFTLIELLIYMGLLSIFILVMTDLLTQILDLQVDASSSSIVIADGQYLRDRLSYDIRRSTAVTIPASSGQSSTQLQLTTAEGTLIFSQSANALVINNGVTTDRLTNPGASVSGLLVTRSGNGSGKDTLTIQFTLESQATLYTRKAESKTYSYTMGLR